MRKQMAKKQLSDDDYVDLLKKIRKDLSKIEDRLSITDPEDLHREVPHAIESLCDYVDKEIKYFTDYHTYDPG